MRIGHAIGILLQDVIDYVTPLLNAKFNKSGGTITGNLQIDDAFIRMRSGGSTRTTLTSNNTLSVLQFTNGTDSSALSLTATGASVTRPLRGPVTLDTHLFTSYVTKGYMEGKILDSANGKATEIYVDDKVAAEATLRTDEDTAIRSLITALQALVDVDDVTLDTAQKRADALALIDPDNNGLQIGDVQDLIAALAGKFDKAGGTLTNDLIINSEVTPEVLLREAGVNKASLIFAGNTTQLKNIADNTVLVLADDCIRSDKPFRGAEPVVPGDMTTKKYVDNGFLPQADASLQVQLITGLSNQGMPNIDTIAKTLTIYGDTILRSRDDVQILGNNPIVIDLAVAASSAIQIYYSFPLNQFLVLKFSISLSVQQRADRYQLFAFIRLLGTIEGSYASLLGSYRINGVPFGILRREQPNNTIRSVAHRGSSAKAPENTIPAYQLASQEGYCYAECDIEWTSDNVPVLLHDTTINRTSNGTGAISGMTLATAKTFDFGSWKSANYAGTKIPTLAEFLTVCKKLGLRPVLEVKGSITAARAAILKQVVNRSGMKGKVSWLSFSSASVSEILSAMPASRVSFITTSVPALQALKTSSNEVFATFDYSELASKGNAFLDAGFDINVYTVNDQSQAVVAMDKGVTYITTDTLRSQDIGIRSVKASWD